jgi:flagellar export protein FliJ
MASFKFRLAAVLRFRQRVKEEKEWELGLIIDARRRKEQEIVAIEEEQRRAIDASLTERNILSIVDLQQHATYDESLARTLQEKRAQLKQIDQAIAAKREELLEALRHVRVLEQLRDRWAEKFQREQNIQEQKIADELSQQKATRPAGGHRLP